MSGETDISVRSGFMRKNEDATIRYVYWLKIATSEMVNMEYDVLEIWRDHGK